MSDEPQQNWPFSKPLEFLQRIKYGGAVGKQVALAIAALLVLAVLGGSAWGQIGAVYVIAPTIIVVVLAGLYSVQRTLDKHPELASLEGREYLEYRKFEMASKGNPALPPSPNTTNPAGPPVIEGQIIREIGKE